MPTSKDQKATPLKTLTFAVLSEMSQQVFVELPWYLVQTLTRHLSLFFNVSYSFFVHVKCKKSCPPRYLPLLHEDVKGTSKAANFSVHGCKIQHKYLHLFPPSQDVSTQRINFIFDGNVPTTTTGKH